MSRIAYIISAYKDAPHLARLVAALDDRADFYVHITSMPIYTLLKKPWETRSLSCPATG